MDRRQFLNSAIGLAATAAVTELAYSGSLDNHEISATPTVHFTHDYSVRDHEIVDYGFYELPELPGFIFRGPAVDITSTNNYFCCIGAAQTLGVYVATPFSQLLTMKLGIPGWNLGVGGASPSFYLQHPDIFSYINKGRFAILQIMTARDEPNDRMKPTAISSVVRDLKHGDITLSQIIWQRIIKEEPDKLEKYIAQSRKNWEKHMMELMSLITVPIIPFWFSPKSLDAKLDPQSTSVAGIVDSYPQFINNENLHFLNEKGNPIIACHSNRNWHFDLRSRYTGKVVEVDYAVMDKSGKTPSFKESRNTYYPSAEMHWDATGVLSDAIESQKLM